MVLTYGETSINNRQVTRPYHTPNNSNPMRKWWLRSYETRSRKRTELSSSRSSNCKSTSKSGTTCEAPSSSRIQRSSASLTSRYQSRFQDATQLLSIGQPVQALSASSILIELRFKVQRARSKCNMVLAIDRARKKFSSPKKMKASKVPRS